jgi:hypothetical protein
VGPSHAPVLYRTCRQPCLQAAYDDFYDADYEEPELESGACLSADVCGSRSTGRRKLHSIAEADTPPVPLEPHHTRSLLRVRHAKRRGMSVPNVTTEVNPRDSADGQSYDPAFGEGPYGESLCDAPPHRSFNHYG